MTNDDIAIINYPFVAFNYFLLLTKLKDQRLKNLKQVFIQQMKLRNCLKLSKNTNADYL
ncbi:MAG: hypothetical protein ACI4L6_02645 [Candidatus Onthoplasma sp.]